MRSDLATALKKRDGDTVRVLRTLLAAVDNATSRHYRNEIDDELVLGLLRGEAEELSVALGEFERAGEVARAADLARRLDIVGRYLPDPT